METPSEPLPLRPLLPCSYVTLLLTSASGRELSTRTRPGGSHWSSTHSASLRPCLCMWACAGACTWGCETRDVEWAVPAHLGREAGTTVGPTAEGMGQGRLGVQAHRLQGLQAVGVPWAPQKHWMSQLDSRAERRAVLPWTPAVSCSLLAQLSWPFPPQEQCFEAVWRGGGARGPQLGGDLVSDSLLVYFCLQRGVNRQDTAGGDHWAGVALPGCGVHLPDHWCHGR